MDNKSIRKKMCALRKAMPQSEVKWKSEQIVMQCLPYCCDNAWIALYSAVRSEVDVSLLYELKKTSCHFAYPRMISETEMEFVAVKDDSLWNVSSLGIKEPSKGHIVSANQLDVIFVPVVAFRTDGYRLGHGLGCYDRYLRLCNAKKIGVAYEFQLQEQMQIYAHDVKLDMIISEQNIYQTD